MPPGAYEALFAVTAFILGACIGSFLNVCIYRMPLEISVNNPSRSFCPKCKYQIPWWNNLPLFSWLLLRGKCANCGARIPVRYFGVELLTGLLFLAVWWRVGMANWILAFPYWIMVSLFIIATFIDFEHFMIPDRITWGGTIAGIALSTAIPMLHGQEESYMGGFWALVGAAAGYALLWVVVQLGKKAFGKEDFKLAAATPFTWTRIPGTAPEGGDSDAKLVVGDSQRTPEDQPPVVNRLRKSLGKPPLELKSWLWSDLFSRESDQLLMEARGVEIDGEKIGDQKLVFGPEELTAAGRTWRLEKTDFIRGTVESLSIPREAMGFGDVKFIACIGAFLGWKAVLFTVMSASMAGAIVGLGAIALGRREWSAKIPFGPYLALGALGWLFAGPELLHWYWNHVVAPPMT